MSSINGVGGSAAYQYAQKPAVAQPASDPDHDGDNDAGVSKAQEAAEQTRAQSIRTAAGGIDTQA